MTDRPQDQEPEQPSYDEQPGQPRLSYEKQPDEPTPSYGEQPGQPMPPSYGQQPSQPMPPSYGQQPSQPMPPGYGQPPFQPVPMSPADQRTWAIAAHLSPLLSWLAGGLTFLGPLILYVVFKDRGPFIRHHTAETLNFQLTMWIGLVISFVLMFILIGFVTAGLILLAMLICHILGAVAASEGREFRYPFTIRFVS